MHMQIASMPPNAEVRPLQGTLDVLILKIVALGPIHGYAIAQRLQQISRDAAVQQGRLSRAPSPREAQVVRAEWAASTDGMRGF
jgi:hypothetical protein